MAQKCSPLCVIRQVYRVLCSCFHVCHSSVSLAKKKETPTGPFITSLSHVTLALGWPVSTLGLSQFHSASWAWVPDQGLP